MEAACGLMSTSVFQAAAGQGGLCSARKASAYMAMTYLPSMPCMRHQPAGLQSRGRVTDNDEVPNSERSPGAARQAAALILIYVAATLAGVLAATT